MLSITTSAPSLALLTAEELRAAAGVAGNGSDAALAAVGKRVAAAIMTECRIAIGSGGLPTLLRETLTETLHAVNRWEVVLRRRHEIEIASIAVDGVALEPAQYFVDPESGILTRLEGDMPVRWVASKMVIVYDAGFAQVPGDLAMAAADFVRLAWQEQQRDPALKAIETDVPGVMRERREYWVGSVPGQAAEGVVPAVVAGQLQRFRNYRIA